MAAPAKNTDPKVGSYAIMLRFLVFYLFFFAVLFLVGMFGVVAEA